MLEIGVASVVVMIASLVGVVSVWRWLGFLIEQNLGYLVSFTAGVFMIVFLQLTGEVTQQIDPWYHGSLWIILGALLWWSIFSVLPHFHAHTDTVQEMTAKPIRLNRLIVADIFHNIGDGILLTSAFMVNPSLGMATTGTIFLHEVVQEISEFFIFRSQGLSVIRALGLNFLVSSAILIGSIGSFYVFDIFSSLEIPFLGVVAGAFLVTVVMDFIPHSHQSSGNWRDYAIHILWFIIGAMIMFGVNTVTGHSHEGEGHHDHHEETMPHIQENDEDHHQESHHDDKEHSEGEELRDREEHSSDSQN